MGTSWGKIAVAVRCGRSVDPAFLQCWTQLILEGLRPGDSVLAPSIEIMSHYSADYLARRFLASSADSILYIDDDMIFGSESLEQMRDNLEGQECDVLSGLFVSRSSPHIPIVWKAVGEISTPQTGKVLPVITSGLGFTLIRRSVFEVMNLRAGEIYFSFPKDGSGDDTAFFDKAVSQGCKIGVACDVNIGHRFPVVARWNYNENAVEFTSTGYKRKGNEK